jgi:ATP-binding cassette subfamily E protein 1
MSMVDFMADELVILYGKPSVYGIVSQPMTTLEGINVYMDGYIPSENVRFRPEEFNLKPSIELVNQDIVDDEKSFVPYGEHLVVYPLSKFSLQIPSDRVNLQGSIHVIMGENGNGKSTFLKYIAKTIDVPVSYKTQTLSIKKYVKDGVYPTVSELFYSNIHLSYTDARFQNDVVRPLQIGDITDRRLDQLSGGELQRVLLILCLGTPASIYMIDEPSANLDIEKRMTVIKVIKRFILNYKKCAFVIEHDMMMAVAFSQEYTSRILTISKTVRDGQRECVVSRYMNFADGITSFLKMLDITMRISNHNRPRINKSDSQLDKEQKSTGMFYV